MSDEIAIRDTTESDLPVLFEHQRDPESSRMAAFVSRDPNDQEAFQDHWKRLLSDPTIIVKTVLWNGRVAGWMGSFLWNDKPQITYWIGKEYWGKGIATMALIQFLSILKTRPLYASAAADNAASLRVLEKCGFVIQGYEKSFAMMRGREIEEVFLRLDT